MNHMAGRWEARRCSRRVIHRRFSGRLGTASALCRRWCAARAACTRVDGSPAAARGESALDAKLGAASGEREVARAV